MIEIINCSTCKKELPEDPGTDWVMVKSEVVCVDDYKKMLPEHQRKFISVCMDFFKWKGSQLANDEVSLTHYRGRFFYEGPGITAPWDVLEALKTFLKRKGVEYQLDNMGLQGIIYSVR
jgi:hypothetical protein